MSDALEQQMRQALGDDLTWQILTADSEGRAFAARWLREAVSTVRADRKIRKARSVAQRADVAAHTREWHRINAEFADWDARSRAFERRVVKRLGDLGLNEQGHPTAATSDAKAIEKARAHAKHCEVQLKHAVNSLADLASLVEAHVAGQASLEELNDALDDLTVAHNGEEVQTLRDLLAGKRAAYARAFAKEAG